MRNPLKKYVLCHLTYGLADPVDLRWGQPRYVTLKGLKRQKELGYTLGPPNADAPPKFPAFWQCLIFYTARSRGPYHNLS